MIPTKNLEAFTACMLYTEIRVDCKLGTADVFFFFFAYYYGDILHGCITTTNPAVSLA